MIYTKNKQTGQNESIAQRGLEHLGWGFRFFVNSELEAFKAAYGYRHHEGEVKVEYAQGAKEWAVTVFKKQVSIDPKDSTDSSTWKPNKT